LEIALLCAFFTVGVDDLAGFAFGRAVEVEPGSDRAALADDWMFCREAFSSATAPSPMMFESFSSW
jgi:hypothetical protein